MRIGVHFETNEKRSTPLVPRAPQQNRAFAWFAQNPWFHLHRYRGNDPEWLERWERTIPRYCKCEEGYRQIKERTPPRFDTPDDFFRWTIDVHNEVNAKLDNERKRYPQVSISEALRLWRSDLAFWQPIQFGGLERWSISMARRLRSFGTIVHGNIGDEWIAETLLEISPRVRLLDAAKHGVPIVMSCVPKAAPILDSDLILLAHGYCDWTRDWVMSSHGVCRRLVGVSQVVAEHVTQWTGRPCDVIENGVEIERLTPTITREEMRLRLEIPLDAFVVGYTGRIAREKRCDLLVQAIHEMDGAYLVLCGWFTKDAERVRQIADDLGVGHRVRMLEPIDQVGNFLNAIDVFATVPSTEGFGLSVVEAMQFGLPVVSTNLGIVHDLAERHGDFGPSILEVNADPSAIAHAIETATESSIDLSDYSADAMAERWRRYLSAES
jgi:glycosyltransferase involved in cell wall biosynthesis